MICPKCRTRMRGANDMSIQSGLENGDGMTTMCRGRSCPICGAWVEDDFVPAMSVPKQEKHGCYEYMKADGLTPVQRGEKMYSIIRDKWKEIDAMIEQGASAASVITKLGLNMSDNTYYKYIRRMRSEQQCNSSCNN